MKLEMSINSGDVGVNSSKITDGSRARQGFVEDETDRNKVEGSGRWNGRKNRSQRQ